MQAFSGIRVLDLTHIIAGPFCTYQLAVLGADVIKIESPDNPDVARGDGPDAEQNQLGFGAVYTTQASNKRALTLNLKSEEGRAILKRLIPTADVLVENYRSGALPALGLGYEAVAKINPKLIYCSLTGFGQSGCNAEQTAYDNVIQAFSGLMAATGTTEIGPTRVGPPVLDYGTGAQAAFAIAAALFQRASSGKGQYIDIAMLDAAIMMMGVSVNDYFQTGHSPVPPGNSSLVNAGYGCFHTQKGLLMVGAYSGKQAARLWQALGEPEIATKVETLMPGEMRTRFAQDRPRLQDILSSKSADEWEVLFNQVGVPAARVRTLNEALEHSQLQARSVIQKVPKSGSTTDTSKYPVAAFRYQQEGPRVSTPPPGIGEHTDVLLEELGYVSNEISDFRERKII